MIGGRAAELIAALGLAPHPEGGYFREVYRSASRVQPAGRRSERRALTTIYFLLVADEVSRWHRVSADEVWHYYEGDELELLTADEEFEEVTRTMLGRKERSAFDLVHIVVANRWQAARTLGSYTLVGCTVAPGFEFEDFQMLRDRPLDAETLRRRHPDLTPLI
jgi:predicted cupin superfamily sugar epimerase